MIAAPARSVCRRAVSPSPDPPDCPSRHRAAAPPSSGSSGQGYCGAPAGLKDRCFPVPFPQPCRRRGGLQDSPPAWPGHTRPAANSSRHSINRITTAYQFRFISTFFRPSPRGRSFSVSVRTVCRCIAAITHSFVSCAAPQAGHRAPPHPSRKRQGFPCRQPCR